MQTECARYWIFANMPIFFNKFLLVANITTLNDDALVIMAMGRMQTHSRNKIRNLLQLFYLTVLLQES